MTHVQPSEILDDPLLYAAFRDEAEAASWTDLHELLAVNAEVSHAVLRQAMAAAGAKGQQLPDPLRIPRPGDEKKEPIRLAPRDAARIIARGGA